MSGPLEAATPRRVPGHLGCFFVLLAVAFWLSFSILILGHVIRSCSPKPDSTLELGAAWLASRQQTDGAWRGEEVAVLRPGPAMTAFVLYSLARLPEPHRARHTESMNRAVRYLEGRINQDGIVGMEPSGPDYPNYATSLTLMSFVALKPAGWESMVNRMVEYLKRSQLDETEGWTPEHPEYGGWGFGGPPRPRPDAHRLDISMTRFAIQALFAAGVSHEDPVWAKARRFVEGCQNFGRDSRDDGGFSFTPLSGQNKAGEQQGFHMSYGTATADGLYCLRFSRGSRERQDVALKWIESRFTIDRCPGFPLDHPRPWADGLRGYWLATATLFAGPDLKSRIAASVAALQRPDGSWANAEPIMLENEPLLATALAVLALAEAGR